MRAAIDTSETPLDNGLNLVIQVCQSRVQNKFNKFIFVCTDKLVLHLYQCEGAIGLGALLPWMR